MKFHQRKPRSIVNNVNQVSDRNRGENERVNCPLCTRRLKGQVRGTPVVTVTRVASTCKPRSRPCTDTTVRVALTTVSVVSRARAGLARLGYCVTAAVFSSVQQQQWWWWWWARLASDRSITQTIDTHTDTKPWSSWLNRQKRLCYLLYYYTDRGLVPKNSSGGGGID